MTRWRIRFRRSEWTNGYEALVVGETRTLDGDTTCQVLTTEGRIDVEPAAVVPDGARFRFDASAAQSLMDELYAAGVRPSEHTWSEGRDAATQAHLQDMRRLTDALLPVVLEHAKAGHGGET